MHAPVTSPPRAVPRTATVAVPPGAVVALVDEADLPLDGFGAAAPRWLRDRCQVVRTALSDVDHRSRREKLRGLARREELDALVVTSLVDVRHATGLDATSAAMLVPADPATPCTLVTDDRYEGAARARLDDDLQLVVDRRTATVLAETMGKGACDHVGFQEHELSWAFGERLRENLRAEVVPTGELVAELRCRKGPAELAALQAANLVTSAAMVDAVQRLRPGVTEREVATWLDRAFVELGADGTGFPSIVAFGPNAAEPHHRPTDRALAAGDVVKVDAGCTVGGYHADVTRTVAMGDPGERLRDVHDVVRRAQDAGVAAAVHGADAREVDRAARDVVPDAGLGERFSHGTGHGTGLAIHELPRVARGATATLRAPTVLTVEPGVYLDGVGGVRIEDSVAVTADGPVRLSTMTRDLLEL